MAKPKDTPARVYGMKCMARLHQTMLPLLMASGMRSVEDGIGRPYRFFQRARQRDALRVSDYFAACARMDQDPVDLMAKAMKDEIDSEIRAPRIVAAARQQIDADGEGIGAERIAELESSVQTEPHKTQAAVKRELKHASRLEVPQLLGLYGSCLRIDSDLGHAELVLKEALEIAKNLDLPILEADLLIRLAYVAQEKYSTTLALRYSQEATLTYSRLDDREGEGRGFLTTGMFRYYLKDYRDTLRDMDAVLKRCQLPRRRFAALLGNALCWIALGEEERARHEAAQAREFSSSIPIWRVGKLEWIQARLTCGDQRLSHLRSAQAAFSENRSADCLLVTVEKAEELLSLGRISEAGREVPLLCDLVERAAESRQVFQAVSRLVRHRTRLTPGLVDQLKRALDRARDRRLSPFDSE